MSQPHTRKPILWLGAHKTGTTFLQNALMLSQEVLADHGLQYMEQSAFRAKYTRPLIYKRTFRRARPPDNDLNLIFDENIPNLVQHVLSSKGLYPDLVPHSRRISAHFGWEAPDIYFGIRSYVGFLPSLYCEVLKSTPYQPFNQFYDPQRHRVDWNDVVDRLRKAFPRSRIHMNFYEQLRGSEARLLAAITGVPASEFIIPKKISRPGFSHAAVEALLEMSKTRLVTTEDIFLAIRRFQRSKEFPSYQPFNNATVEELNKSYLDHIARLRLRNDINMMDC